MRMYSVKSKTIIGALALLAVAGCASVSPQRISTDRMNYGEVITDSWKRQTLLNVVRLRYADAPVFLDVASVINSYSVSGKATGSAKIMGPGPDPNEFGLGAESTWSNTPTVTYQPLLGDRFTRSMLQPVPPAAVFQLMQSGWLAEIVFPSVVGSINGLRNDSAGVGADPGFRELVERLSRIQRAGGLAIRVAPRKEGSAVVMALRQGGKDPGLIEDDRRVRELLGLEEDASELEITFGLLPRNRHEVAVISRSILELLLQLGFGIDLPQAHVRAGCALPGRQQAGNAQATALTHIRSGIAAPADAYAAVPYKGYWFWIDDNDIASKRIFTFLLILTSLAETSQGTATPVVTVPSR